MRQTEHVVGIPAYRCLANSRRTVPLANEAHCIAGCAEANRFRAPVDLSQIAVHQWHGRTAGDRIDVSHPSRTVLPLRRRSHGVARSSPGITKDRRELRRLIT